ncbi:hypothetical protein COI67_27575 [Bacillus cereus]|nr:hypothetical protein COI67_27575 [Bacillus cereus]
MKNKFIGFIITQIIFSLKPPLNVAITMFNALKTPSVHLLSSPDKHHNNVCLANIYESVINPVQFLYSNQIP